MLLHHLQEKASGEPMGNRATLADAPTDSRPDVGEQNNALAQRTASAYPEGGMSAVDLETVARALRDATYDDPVKDDAWSFCKPSWCEKADMLIDKLGEVGFEIVRKK